jgi:hemoglobin-like flavoprotein
MTDVSYATVMQVTMSWDKFKTADQTRGGETIFLRLFELEPEARTLFKFTEHEDIKKNPQFAAHARAIFDMIDLVISSLGPDLEPLAEDLIDLGRRHIQHGVHKSYLPIMQRSVVDSLSQILGRHFTEDDREAWKVIFKFLISHMIKGMTQP